jgi:methylmalonyl-CoA mutase, N-terminal domain
MGEAAKAGRESESGFSIKPIYVRDDLPDDLDQRLSTPREYPNTPGVYQQMYTTRPWTSLLYT